MLDENDHVPLTSEPVYWAHVAENSPPRTPVARITAIDGDRDTKLTYQLKAGNPQSLFDIDPHSGKQTARFASLAVPPSRPTNVWIARSRRRVTSVKIETPGR